LVLLTPPAPSHIYPLSLHDALPILAQPRRRNRGQAARAGLRGAGTGAGRGLAARAQASDRPDARFAAARVRHLGPGLSLFLQRRSEEHTSELQSRRDLVCRLLLEKK